VVRPAPEETCFSESNRAAEEKLKVAPEVVPERERKADLPDLETAPYELIAIDIRQAIVALLVAKETDVPGRWLDVYATRAVDENVVYVVIPATRLKAAISECLGSLIDRKLDDQETKWILSRSDVEKLLGADGGKLQAA
jgi:hypothetical protein